MPGDTTKSKKKSTVNTIVPDYDMLHVELVNAGDIEYDYSPQHRDDLIKIPLDHSYLKLYPDGRYEVNEIA